MLVALKPPKCVVHTLRLLLLLCLVATTAQAQSLDIAFPAPVRANEVVGAIAARDLGDSRLTDHFYSFTGTPGDVLITVKSSNLNGDIDVFTAGSLRPLLKFTLYAESSSPISKGIYLRKREDLILRVEARSPNDEEGTYHIRFGGSFEPMAGAALVAETESGPVATSEPGARPAGKQVRRVSSVGARIYEPPPPAAEVASAPTPEESPPESPGPTAAAKKSAEAGAPITRPARNTSSRRSAGRRRPASEPAKMEETAALSEPEKEKVAKVSESKPNLASVGRRTGGRSTAARPAKSPPEREPQTGPRLLIQMQDGTRVERFMNTIRRVTVENDQIVVVRRDGKVERTQMAEVVRMSIEP